MGTYFIYLSSLGFDVKGSLTEPQDSKPKSAIFAHSVFNGHLVYFVAI
jgi:hypothetical protein